MADEAIAFQRPGSSRGLNWTTDQPYLPIFKTTFPNQAFNCMAGGRPTVLWIDGVIHEGIEAAESGVFVRPGDANALAEAVQDTAAGPALRIQQGSRARAYVVQDSDQGQQAIQFAEFLEGFDHTAR